MISFRLTFLVPGLAAVALFAGACSSGSDGPSNGTGTAGSSGNPGIGGGSLGGRGDNGGVGGDRAAGNGGHSGGGGVAGGETGGSRGTVGTAGTGGSAGNLGTSGAAGGGGGSGVGAMSSSGGASGSGGGAGTAGGANAGRAGGASGGGGSESGGTGGSSVSRAISFAPAVGYAARAPQFVTLADFNKDGKLDAATVSFFGDASVLLGNGNGTLQPERTYISTAVAPGTAIVASDFNNDGNPDLAFSMKTYGFGTLLGNGDGTFRSFTSRLFGSTEGGLGAADLNGDGKLDFVMAFPRRPGAVAGAYVTLGNGDGTFQEARAAYTAPSTYAGLVLVDFNKDGRLDIVTSGGGFVSVLLGNGDGTFPFTGTDFPVASGTFIPSLAVGDLNGDGALDVVAPDTGGRTLNVFLGKGDGTLLEAKQFPCGLDPADVKVADLNVDGLPDIVATNDSGPGNPGTVAVLAGKGDGTFDPYVAFGTGMGPHAVSIADLDGDTRPDLVVANKNDGTVSVLLNTSH